MTDEALEAARERAREQRRKAEHPLQGDSTDLTTAVGMALVRAAIEKARKS